MREKFHWKVQLQGEDGQVVDHRVSTYWDPEAEDAAAAVANAAQAEAYVKCGKQMKFAPVKVERVKA